MRRSSWTPSIVPNDNDEKIYLVADDFGRLGRARIANVPETWDSLAQSGKPPLDPVWWWASPWGIGR
jgi:hypothetical protein